jgi:drug/metabolite transporter (DMT)-like permease
VSKLNLSDNETSPVRGILWMLAATSIFVGLDTVAKYLSQTYPVPQVLWARYIFHMVLIVLFLGRRLPLTLRTARLGLQLLRSVFLLTATGFFFTAISFVPLADATAIMFVAPILVTALSMPLLREYVGPRRWASVFVGFLGALIIIRPGTEAMDPAALFALGAAGAYGLYQIATRRLSGSDTAYTTLFYSGSVGALATSLFVPLFWVPPSPEDWAIMASLGLFGGLGHFALIRALEAAPIATVTPFNYASLLWATLLGFVVFDDLPDVWTALGAAIIAGSGLYIVYRERVRRVANTEA